MKPPDHQARDKHYDSSNLSFDREIVIGGSTGQTAFSVDAKKIAASRARVFVCSAFDKVLHAQLFDLAEVPHNALAIFDYVSLFQILDSPAGVFSAIAA